MGNIIRGKRIIAQPLNVARVIAKLQLLPPEMLVKLSTMDQDYMIESLEIECDDVVSLHLIELLEDDTIDVNHDQYKDIL